MKLPPQVNSLYESRYASDLVALGFFVIEAYQFSKGNTAHFLGQP